MNSIWKKLNIVREFALTDFRFKYHDSALGYLWSMLNPLAQFVVLHFVFSYLFVVQVPKFTFYLLSGIVFWNFFYDATLSSINSIHSKAVIAKKIYFPRCIIVFSSTATALISFTINTLLLWLIIIIFDNFSFIQLLVFIPFFTLVFLTLGISFILSTLFIYYRDTVQIWLVCLNIGFWLTPIVYNALTAPAPLQTVALLNPVGRIMVMLRAFFVFGNFPSIEFIVSTVLLSIVVFIFGLFIFNKHSYKIVEYL